MQEMRHEVYTDALTPGYAGEYTDAIGVPEYANDHKEVLEISGDTGKIIPKKNYGAGRTKLDFDHAKMLVYIFLGLFVLIIVWGFVTVITGHFDAVVFGSLFTPICIFVTMGFMYTMQK